jgi:hypothetical protein
MVLWLYRNADAEFRVWIDIAKHFRDLDSFVRQMAKDYESMNEKFRRKAEEYYRKEGMKWSP